MASNNALSTALALASSKTNWTAIVPARAPPPPPPVSWKDGMCWTCCVKPGTNSTFRDALGENELTCDKCHRREYPQDYDCSICGLRGDACESGGSTVGTITVCGRDIEVCEDCDTDGDNYDGFLDKYVFCAETSSYEEKDIVGCCEKCAVEIVRDSDEHDNCHIIDGGDAADKFRCQRCLVDCPCDECDEDKAQCVLCSKWAVSATMSYDDAVGEHSCCDCDPNGDVLLGEQKYAICQVCGIDECVDYDDSLCHGCYHKDVGASECWCDGVKVEWLTDRARDALKKWAAEKEEVKKYKAVLAETLRFEAIMDMMKSGDA